MKILRQKKFANGAVYALSLYDGMPIEVTDTFLPFYTKDAINENTNCLKASKVGSRDERWMIGVSTMSGCPVKCKFCATGKLKRWRNLTAEEILNQILFVIDKNVERYSPRRSKEFKINYTRMGEPFLNLEEVRKAVNVLDSLYSNVHHYVSTIGLKGSDFSWINDNVTLQISLHSLDEKRRKELIPIKGLMSLEELGQIRTYSNLKTTINLTLVDEKDFDIDKLKKYFDPKYFFIKLSPINVNDISEQNGLGSGIIKQTNLI